jgi:hypothetical protein
VEKGRVGAIRDNEGGEEGCKGIRRWKEEEG